MNAEQAHKLKYGDLVEHVKYGICKVLKVISDTGIEIKPCTPYGRSLVTQDTTAGNFITIINDFRKLRHVKEEVIGGNVPRTLVRTIPFRSKLPIPHNLLRTSPTPIYTSKSKHKPKNDNGKVKL